MKVWLLRDANLYEHFSDKMKFIPAGTCLFLGDVAHDTGNLMYVYGNGIFDKVPVEWLTLESPEICPLLIELTEAVAFRLNNYGKK